MTSLICSPTACLIAVLFSSEDARGWQAGVPNAAMDVDHGRSGQEGKGGEGDG